MGVGRRFDSTSNLPALDSVGTRFDADFIEGDQVRG